MSKSAHIAVQPPDEIVETLVRLGKNIRTARLRRNVQQAQLAKKLGISRALVAQLEQGNPKSSIAVYLGALWAMGLLDDMRTVANPDTDAEGRTLERLRFPTRARVVKRRQLSDSF